MHEMTSVMVLFSDFFQCLFFVRFRSGGNVAYWWSFFRSCAIYCWLCGPSPLRSLWISSRFWDGVTMYMFIPLCEKTIGRKPAKGKFQFLHEELVPRTKCEAGVYRNVNPLQQDIFCNNPPQSCVTTSKTKAICLEAVLFGRVHYWSISMHRNGTLDNTLPLYLN